MRLAIRGFIGKEKIWESEAQVNMAKLDEVLPDLAKEHAEVMARGELTMIEIEFLDDPGPDRFFRIGTSPERMVIPIKVDLS